MSEAIHSYAKVDLVIVWKTVREDVSHLKLIIQDILKQDYT